jgi:hypothetical protein
LTSTRRRQGSPVRSVYLTVSFRSTKGQASELKSFVPALTFRNGVCKVRIATKSTKEAAENARELLERVREIVKPAKGFKGSQGRRDKN